MWILNQDIGKWIKTENTVTADNFNLYKQQAEQTQLYSKIKSGSVYTYINDISNIYENLSYVKNSVISPTFSEWNKYISENSFIIKNKFTPTKAISEFLSNHTYVNLCSTTNIEISSFISQTLIDGIKPKDGYIILLKDQKNKKENGIYTYNKNKLTKIIFDYKLSHNNVVCIKEGFVNINLKYKLNRNIDGYYPIEGEEMNWTLCSPHILRHRVDYNNIYNTNYYSIINDNGRVLSTGDFGVIYINQSNSSDIINNPYKYILYCIYNQEDNSNYFSCGEQGTLLSINKNDLSIKKIDLNIIFTLRKIHFLDINNGVIVGDSNTIFITNNAGITWTSISNSYFDDLSYNSVIYYSYNKIYIVGNSGCFLELTLVNNNWTFYKRSITLYTTLSDESIIYDDINDIKIVNFTDWIGDCFLSLVGNNSRIILFDINENTNYDFIHLECLEKIGDINNIININNNLIISSNYVYQLDINSFIDLKQPNNKYDIGTFSNNTIISSTSSVILDTNFVNNLFINNNNEIYSCGNSSLIQKFDGTLFSSFDFNFYTKYKPKMLVLDYDIANKSTFFDSNQNYILPNTSTFSYFQISSTVSISNIDGETNWLNYYKDSLKVYSYQQNGINNSNEILISTNFSNTSLSLTKTISTSNITINNNDLIGLIPTNNNNNSLYGNANIIYSSTYSLYLGNNILVICLPINTFSCNLGDILLFYTDDSSINDKLIINRIDIYNSFLYIWCYHTFNKQMITSIKNDINSIIIKNLNLYNDYNSLVYSLSNHPISNGYKISGDINNISLTPIFNNYTAYYNMQLKIDINSSVIYNLYNDNFLSFKYNPIYNLYDFLNNVDSEKFTQSHTFDSLINTYGVECSNTTKTENNIFIDTNQRNTLSFGTSSIWNTIFKNMYIDININPYTSNTNTNKLLVIDKYYDSNHNRYIIKFDKPVVFLNGDYNSIDFIQRNTLQQISQDLQDLSNKQKGKNTKTLSLINNNNKYDSLLSSKFSTESYYELLVSDLDIRKVINTVIYTDNNNELSLSVLNLSKSTFIQISSFDVDLNSNNQNISTLYRHNLKEGNYVYINISVENNNGDTINDIINGVYVIISITNDTNFIIDKPGNDFEYYQSNGYNIVNGYITFLTHDPFFNFEPIDIFEVGFDKVAEIAVGIEPINLIESENKYSLINLDLTNFKYKLFDGLSISSLTTKYPWVLEAEISNALIGEDSNGLVWYGGIWQYGRWFSGTWYSGSWIDGDWYGGTWNSSIINNNIINISVNNKSIDNAKSIWYNGRFFNGNWNGGTWENGRMYNGNWNGGIWNNGIWNNGNWNNGQFRGGIWVDGIWNGGIFNCDSKPSYWLRGIWNGGDFENGYWYTCLLYTSPSPRD